MTAYRIVCTTQEPVDKPHNHAHIVTVGTGADPSKADRKWTVADAYTSMGRGDNFYTQGERSGRTAAVRKWGCEHCGHPTLRSNPDAVPDNNLDNLRRCNWP